MGPLSRLSHRTSRHFISSRQESKRVVPEVTNQCNQMGGVWPTMPINITSLREPSQRTPQWGETQPVSLPPTHTHTLAQSPGQLSRASVFKKFMSNFFQLQFTFNIIVYWFQVCSTVVRQSHTLQSVPLTLPAPAGHHTPLLRYYWLHFLALKSEQVSQERQPFRKCPRCDALPKPTGKAEISITRGARCCNYILFKEKRKHHIYRKRTANF